MIISKIILVLLYYVIQSLVVPMDDALEDIKTQTRSVLAQIDALLARAGSSKTRLLSTMIYLTTFDNFKSMNEEWLAWLPVGMGPARATIGNITLANPKWLIEVVVTAAV
jgi:enamine deaminase RidA (YjgF/YER057c/UK114 family)